MGFRGVGFTDFGLFLGLGLGFRILWFWGVGWGVGFRLCGLGLYKASIRVQGLDGFRLGV